MYGKGVELRELALEQGGETYKMATVKGGEFYSYLQEGDHTKLGLRAHELINFILSSRHVSSLTTFLQNIFFFK